MDKQKIDDLLDKYNDYMMLYDDFGDIHYKLTADSIKMKFRREVALCTLSNG